MKQGGLLGRRALGWLGPLLFVAAACGKVANDAPGPVVTTPASDLGTACASSTECTSGNCIPVLGAPISGGGVCTIACESEASCTVAGWSCVPRPGAESLCQCASAPGACNGRDDDCNGKVDDSPADSACADGRSCEAGACVCRGTQCGTTCVDTQTDPFHCGGCGVTCGDGTTCVAGACRCSAGGALCPPTDDHVCGLDERCHVATTVDSMSGMDTIRELRMTTEAIYVAWEQHGLSYTLTNVSWVDKATSAITQSLSVTSGQYGAIGADENGLAFATSSNPSVGPSVRPIDSVWFCPAGVCPEAPLVTGQPAAAVTPAGAHVYWVDRATGELRRCAKAGCGGVPESVAPAPAGVTSGASSALIADDAYLFVTYASGHVARAPLAAATTLTLLTTSAGASRPSVDDDTLYLVAAAGVLSCPKAGCPGGPAVVTPLASTNAASVASDGTRVYWTERTAPGAITVTSLPKGGGSKLSLLTFAADTNLPAPLGVDAAHVYIGHATTLTRIDK
ncbi:MAG: Tryptophan synthase alpha chain [Labilithrix sp.]|nr:Tryptophan synthase alpha chain [Labilithrix sp.]